MRYHIVYDTTGFVHESIDAVIHTLFEAIILVVLVVVLFLQSWRASVIPLIAVPVSLIGTFAILMMMGFGLNNLTLFGLVLAIGIVVDDAIVVVENVERNIENGTSAVRGRRHRHGRGDGPHRLHRARALRGVRADRLHHRPDRAVLSPVRLDHRHLDGDLGLQLADPVSGPRRRAAEEPRRAQGRLAEASSTGRSAGCSAPSTRASPRPAMAMWAGSGGC